ncbi:hypothetical protein [Nocardioides hankookensis]|uniref:Uncharacterized protein n=1 Tax=Nocardioides hankookensis TaxID=443157 RepID=A0ABW1LER2_9ACTN
MTTDPLRTLEALGDSFEDVLLARLDQVRADLDAASAAGDIVVVVDGPVPAEVQEAVVDHVMVHSGVLLALGVPRESASLGGVEHAGLKIIGGGRLGDLPVTWWAAASADPVDPSDLPGGPTIALPVSSSVDPDAFGARAQLLRSELELARTERPPAGGQRAAVPRPPRRTGAAAAPSAAPVVAQRRLRRRQRLALAALALLGVGVLAGVGLAQVVSDPVAGLTLVAAAAILALLLWGVLVLRRLAVRLEEQAARHRRLSRELDRSLRRLTKRVQVIDTRGLRMRETLRDVEARLAVVSTAAPNAGRGRPNAPYTGDGDVDSASR